ncbi:effector-associated domain 2-containing protein [Saccharopolyspora tripterygii]
MPSVPGVNMAGGAELGRSSSLSLVNALLRVPFLNEVSSRTTVVQLVGEVLGEPFSVPEHAHPFQHVWNIVDACRRHPEAWIAGTSRTRGRGSCGLRSRGRRRRTPGGRGIAMASLAFHRLSGSSSLIRSVPAVMRPW